MPLDTESESAILESAGLFRRIIAEEVTRQLSTARFVVGSAAVIHELHTSSQLVPKAEEHRGRGRHKKSLVAVDHPSQPKSKRRQALSAAGRAAIILAQKKRWAKIRKEAKAKVAGKAPGKPAGAVGSAAKSKSTKATKATKTKPTAASAAA